MALLRIVQPCPLSEADKHAQFSKPGCKHHCKYCARTVYDFRGISRHEQKSLLRTLGTNRFCAITQRKSFLTRIVRSTLGVLLAALGMRSVGNAQGLETGYGGSAPISPLAEPLLWIVDLIEDLHASSLEVKLAVLALISFCSVVFFNRPGTNTSTRTKGE